MKARILAAGLLAVAMALSLVPAQTLASHDPGVPLLDTNAFQGNAWASWRISVPADSHIEIEGRGIAAADAAAANVGAWLLRADGSLYGSDLETWFSDQTIVHAQVLDPDHTLVDNVMGGLGGPFGTSLGFPGLPAGDWIVVVMANSDQAITGGELTVYATEGATIVSETGGAASFFVNAPSFIGTLNAEVSVLLGPQARVIIDAHQAESVGGRLFGLFATVGYGVCTISHTGPDGGGQGSAILNGGPAGTYDFSIDLCVDAGADLPALLFKPHTWVTGADVTLA